MKIPRIFGARTKTTFQLRWRSDMHALLFCVTILLSSFLLFIVQPLVGRMLLPSLGGTPAVWNTCVVFFQAVLLAGYGYTHYVSSRLKPRNQVILHFCLLAVVCFALPIRTYTSIQVPTDSCLLYTSPSPRDATLSRMPSSA